MALQLRIERTFDGAPKDVYDAFLAIYDEPLPDWVLESRRDLRVGGVWDITFEPPGVGAFSEHRILTAVDRPHLLQYRATITSADGQAYDTTVAFAVEHVGTISRASLSQSGFPDEPTRDAFAAAWPDVFDLITEHLSG